MAAPYPDALAALRRWEASGAGWSVRGTDGDGLVVDLLTCDGGEVVGHLASAEASFVAYVRGRPDPEGATTP